MDLVSCLFETIEATLTPCPNASVTINSPIETIVKHIVTHIFRFQFTNIESMSISSMRPVTLNAFRKKIQCLSLGGTLNHNTGDTFAFNSIYNNSIQNIRIYLVPTSASNNGQFISLLGSKFFAEMLQFSNIIYALQPRKLVVEIFPCNICHFVVQNM